MEILFGVIIVVLLFCIAIKEPEVKVKYETRYVDVPSVSNTRREIESSRRIYELEHTNYRLCEQIRYKDDIIARLSKQDTNKDRRKGDRRK